MALKQTSEPVTISFAVVESGSNTFTEETIDLSLSVLDNEVFVITGVKLDPSMPDMDPTVPLGQQRSGVNRVSLTTTSRASIGAHANLGNTNCFAFTSREVRLGHFGTAGDESYLAVFAEHNSQDTPSANLDHIAIVATNDFFIQIQGAGNVNAQGVSGKVYGYRARADASTYAALVQNEVLSS